MPQNYNILDLPPTPENAFFCTLTFIFLESIPRADERFSGVYFQDLKAKCLKIENREISFNVKEFIYFAKIIDYVCKALIGEESAAIKDNMARTYADFDFKSYRSTYLGRSTAFFSAFKKGCRDAEVLVRIERELDW